MPNPVLVDKSPIDVESEAGLIPHDQMTVAQLRMLAEEAVGQRIGLQPTVGLDAKDTARCCEDKVAVQFGSGMRRNDCPMLLGELRNAQRLGETGGARCVELNVTNAALDNEVAHCKAGKLALAMC